ncbi:MarR family winged helix-turn-helix transcriptional regulator [Amycolatopsis sp. H20-H5]|uniref:MarR family winged helix-turn-helix transcriptional regulator n=1 Tax=Amycolatopsis sp. H20-H5 TaxID=3046309 RepID=UPI002DBF735D|nr:MarR family transcriptional regulator [Amycolatopsis sp. H20-H5]MEC3974158.1 MarR family transcriptional regulator [Amycolatopsis sp. H20-H5]
MAFRDLLPRRSPARLRPAGLTPTQFLLLASAGWLEHLGGPPTQQEVAERAGADRMMTSKVIRTLAERGLLLRHAHESDARALRLTLTDEGRELVRAATKIARELDVELFGADTAELRGTLRGIAERRGR